jgi:hypothetical protein
MDETELITSKGRGVWGGTTYELRLLTSSRTYSDSLHQATRTVLRFMLEFGSKSGSDRRCFISDAARRAFIDQSFSDLVLTDIPEAKREPRRVISPLQTIVGEYMSSVTFVMDYLQLGFSDYRFNMYSWPTVTVQSRTLSQRDEAYKNAICALIGETLSAVDEYLDKGLVLQFKNGSSITLFLRVGRDFPGPEVAEFHGPNTTFLIIWRAGEEPFDL